MEQIYIYGDSLLKATVPDESFRYHFHLPEVMNWYPRERVAVTNRSKMGATSTKGLQLVEHDVARGMDARYALVAYGGNDSDYDWPAVAEDPALDHRPRTELPTFVETMRSAVKALREKGVQPVMMTLPPIDAARSLTVTSSSIETRPLSMASIISSVTITFVTEAIGTGLFSSF